VVATAPSAVAPQPSAAQTLQRRFGNQGTQALLRARIMSGVGAISVQRQGAKGRSTKGGEPAASKGGKSEASKGTYKWDPGSGPTQSTATPGTVTTYRVTPVEAVEAIKQAVAESLVEAGGTAGDSDKALVVAELIIVPLPALNALKKKGVKVVVCRGSVTEIRKDLKGVRPRGWPEGKTWDSVPGLSDPNTNRVIIAIRNGRVPPTGDGHGAHNLVLHEVGHAIGDAVPSGGVTDPKFVAARNKDKSRLDAYEGQTGDAGVQETYAESFARFYGNDPADAKTYPNLHAYWAGNPFVAAIK
jgi:hypothetical protein